MHHKPTKISSIEVEKRTVEFMIGLYCRNKRHETDGCLCPECRSLLEYAFRRLDKCRYGEAKPACTRCPVHCYAPYRREHIRRVMRYAGPRMIWHHPIQAVGHLWDFLLARIG